MRERNGRCAPPALLRCCCRGLAARRTAECGCGIEAGACDTGCRAACVDSCGLGEDKFGARGELKPDDRLNEITATVTAVGAKPYGELVVTLDNGQMWAEIAPGSKLKVKLGDSVKIEAGALGSFRLIAPNGRSSKVARVR